MNSNRIIPATLLLLGSILLLSQMISAEEKKGDPGKPIDITFDDLKLEMKEDAVFEKSMLTDRIKELDGKRVRIRGFMWGGITQLKGIERFPMIRNTECKFGPGGQAYHVILVDMKDGVTAKYSVRPMTLEGILTVDPFEGPDKNTWSVYHLVGEKVQ